MAPEIIDVFKKKKPITDIQNKTKIGNEMTQAILSARMSLRIIGHVVAFVILLLVIGIEHFHQYGWYYIAYILAYISIEGIREHRHRKECVSKFEKKTVPLEFKILTYSFIALAFVIFPIAVKITNNFWMFAAFCTGLFILISRKGFFDLFIIIRETGIKNITLMIRTGDKEKNLNKHKKIQKIFAESRGISLKSRLVFLLFIALLFFVFPAAMFFKSSSL